MSDVFKIPFTCRTMTLKSTNWKVRFGPSVHIDATVDPWKVSVTAPATARRPNPKPRVLGKRAAEKLLAKL